MDEKLIKKAIKGNFKAYSILVNELKEDGYKIAYTILKNPDDSMDAYLQAVEKGLKNIKNLKEPKLFKTWFLRIVINESKNIISKNSNIVYLENIERDNSKIYNHEEKLDLENAIKNLDEDVKEMINLKFYLGYTLVEISEIMNLPLGSVKDKIYKSLKKLRKELQLK